jgi:organic hydroperoxide reductase OsmC/OhrA
VELEYGEDGFSAVLFVEVTTKAKVPGITKEQFDYYAEKARMHRMIAKLIKLELGITATLVL